MMGRERNDQMVIQPSIALLQERFRELQRAKEMRAGRELLKNNISEPYCNKKNYDHTLYYYNEPARFNFFQFLPLNSSSSQVSLSLCLDSSQKKEANDVDKSLETPLLASLWPKEKTKTSTNLSSIRNDDDVEIDGFDHVDDVDDVDTSLHL